MNWEQKVYFVLVLFSFSLMYACQSDSPSELTTSVIKKDKIHPSESFLLYKNFPSKYISPRNLEIWLPSNYSKDKKFGVLYMFDGQNIFHGIKGWSGEYKSGWEVDEIIDSLTASNAIADIIVVGLFNGGAKRQSEYMPDKPQDLIQEKIDQTTHDWYVHFKNEAPSSSLYLKYLVEEVKPFVDSNFSTHSGPGNTFVGGSSMGGLMAAFAICEYPKIFGGAACFSTHWPALDGIFVEYIKEHLPNPDTHKIYFDYGTEGLDATYEPFQKNADVAMEIKGFVKEKNWMTIKYAGHDHHEKYWRKRFHRAMLFLLEK